MSEPLRDIREFCLIEAARRYRMEVLPTGDDDERAAADDLDAAIAAYDSNCPLHGGYDPDQRGPSVCPYCAVTSRSRVSTRA